MSTNDPEKERAELLASYAAVFSSADGDRILNNLVLVAQNIPDPMVRCGASDVVLHLLRMRTRGREDSAPRSVVGRAKTQQPTRQTTTDDEG